MAQYTNLQNVSLSEEEPKDLLATLVYETDIYGDLIKTEVNSPAPANVVTILDPRHPHVYHLEDSPLGTESEVVDFIEKFEQEGVGPSFVEPVNPNEGQEILDALSNFRGMVGNPQMNPITEQPHVEILEQPIPNKLRFRYEVEGRSAGALQGISSTAQSKTYPRIKIHGYQGPAVVVVSCVEEEPPHRTHPHNLVGKQCIKGVCRVDVSPDMTAVFPNMGIQCVRKRDSADSLTRRQEIKVDPFKQGFAHATTSNANLNSVRLCFQVFLTGVQSGGQPIIVQPVVSNVIRDKKAHGDLNIINCSEDYAPVEGGKKILIFTEKISRDDIEVHFTLDNGETLKGHFTPNEVHKQYGISLTTPPLTNQNITERVHAEMFLFKPSKRERSEGVDFYFNPKKTQFKQPASQAPQPQKQAQKRNIEKKDNSDSSRAVDIRERHQLNRGSGGNVVEMKHPVATGNSQISFTDQVLNMKEFTSLIQSEATGPSNTTQQTGAPSFPLGGDLPEGNNLSDLMRAVDPNFLENLNFPSGSSSQFKVPINLVDMMSGEFSDKIQLSQSNKSFSKTGQLNTPDVSMEQSKSRNNLDQ